jgi:hypothetical protein
MLRNRRERGEGQFGCLVGLAVLLVAALVAWKMIPVKVKAAEFRETVVDEAKSGGQHNDARIRKAILTKAEDLDLPVTSDDILINRKAASIRVEVAYTVPIEFPGYTYNWNFKHSAENPIF